MVSWKFVNLESTIRALTAILFFFFNLFIFYCIPAATHAVQL